MCASSILFCGFCGSSLGGSMKCQKRHGTETAVSIVCAWTYCNLNLRSNYRSRIPLFAGCLDAWKIRSPVPSPFCFRVALPGSRICFVNATRICTVLMLAFTITTTNPHPCHRHHHRRLAATTATITATITTSSRNIISSLSLSPSLLPSDIVVITVILPMIMLLSVFVVFALQD